MTLRLLTGLMRGAGDFFQLVLFFHHLLPIFDSLLHLDKLVELLTFANRRLMSLPRLFKRFLRLLQALFFFENPGFQQCFLFPERRDILVHRFNSAQGDQLTLDLVKELLLLLNPIFTKLDDLLTRLLHHLNLLLHHLLLTTDRLTGILLPVDLDSQQFTVHAGQLNQPLHGFHRVSKGEFFLTALPQKGANRLDLA